MHAEMNVLFQTIKNVHKSNRFYKKSKTARKLLKANSPLTVYVVRLSGLIPDPNHPFPYVLGKSKPCVNCQALLAQYNVKKIFYTDIIDGVNVLCEMRLRLE